MLQRSCDSSARKSVYDQFPSNGQLLAPEFWLWAVMSQYLEMNRIVILWIFTALCRLFTITMTTIADAVTMNYTYTNIFHLKTFDWLLTNFSCSHWSFCSSSYIVACICIWVFYSRTVSRNVTLSLAFPEYKTLGRNTTLLRLRFPDTLWNSIVWTFSVTLYIRISR